MRKWAAKRSNSKNLSEALKRPFTFVELADQRLSRTTTYLYCDYYFDHFLPSIFQEHRRYFSANGRGFGEDAFHTMWFLLFQQFRPRRALEIGVFRGQTITLMKLMSRHLGFDCDVGCISPFSNSGDSVSVYKAEVDYFQDTVQNHQHFDLPLLDICRSFSTSKEAGQFTASRSWDIIYIDGNHEYNVAKSDWQICAQSIAPNGIIVLDDSALNTDFRPPNLSTAGHPGPSKVAEEIDSTRFRELIGVGHNRVFQRIG